MPTAVRVLTRYSRLFWPVSLILFSATAIAAIGAVVQLDAFGFDSWAYWRPPYSGDELYRAVQDGSTWFGVYRYSPAFLDVLAPIRVLPWPVFSLLWAGMLAAVTGWLTGRYAFLCLAIPFVAVDVLQGNINVLLAAAVVLGFRWPAVWALILLTKVTPGIGLLWFVVRRQWRHLTVALLTTTGIVIASIYLHGIDDWLSWVVCLLNTHTPKAGGDLIPLWLRLPGAVALVVWGASTNRTWTVIVAATLALPIFWVTSLSLAAAGLMGIYCRQAEVRN